MDVTARYLSKIKHGTFRRISLLGAVLFLTIWPISGCASHLHNADDQLLAEHAQTQFEVLKKEQTQVFGAMSENLTSMSRAEVVLYEELANHEAAIQARRVTKMTWEEFRSQLSVLAAELEGKVAGMERHIRTALDQTRLKTTNEVSASRTAEEALTKAKMVLTDWNKRVAVLETLIEITPSLEQALAEVKDVDAFKEKATAMAHKVGKEMKEAEVTYITADGDEDKTNLKDELSTLLDVNGNLVLGKDSGHILAGLRTAFNPDTPGLVVTMAALAKDLADAQRQRTLTELSSLEKRWDVAKRARQLVERANDLSKEGMNLVPAEPFPDTSKTGETIQKLAKKDPKEMLVNAYLALQHYVTIAGQITARVEDGLREDASIQHLQSIETSQINALQRQALVARGIEGLVIYHRGGVKPEEIAEVAYRAVQLGFLGWIGIGVN